MDDIGVVKTADHVYDGIHLTDIGEELVAQSFAFGCAFYKSRNVHELDHGRGGFFRVINFSQLVQPYVRNRHYAYIGVNGAEWVVG